MKKLLLMISLLLFTMQFNVFASNNHPKREFRGAWITTVSNLDWPKSSDPEIQRAELVELLDNLKKTGVNAVLFQVRCECDALYQSAYEPWSYWLTKAQGKAPNPFYDPLELAIEEAHKRGMELHAWFNPYMAVRNVNGYAQDPLHVSKMYPEWILKFGIKKMLDPGLPIVREYVTAIIMDVVERYDVDGVHFDDYFYPYPPDGITNEDDSTFALYSRGFTNRGDWRRDNVNLLIEMVYNSIQSLKPYVKFGISPFGIWKNDTPPGISGLDAYSAIYCDAVAWYNQEIVDYVAPQLYWPFGGDQDYGKLLPWWAQQTNGRHLYAGHGVWRISSWSASEVPNQIRLNRRTANASGSIFFRTTHVLANLKGFTDSLTTDLYRYPAIPPVMPWKNTEAPNEPLNVKYELAASTTEMLMWDSPLVAADGDSAFRYVVYRFDKREIEQADIDDARHILDIVGNRNVALQTPPDNIDPYYYAVASLDRYSNESSLSELVLIEVPSTPVLAYPENNTGEQAPEITLSWHYAPNAVSYIVELASDSSFNPQS